MKYIFFDIDGTLVDIKNKKQYIPESTKKTIKKLQENGHVVGIASGRQNATVQPVAKELDIINIVSDGGYGVTYKGELLYINPLEKDKVIPFVEELLEKEIPFAYMTDPTTDKVYATNKMLAYKDIKKFETLDVVIKEDFDYLSEDTSKVFFELHVGEEDKIKTVDASKIMRYFDTHLAYEPDDKYKGVKEIIELDGGSTDDLIFFGDGLNDIAIAKQAAYSVAMGNAVAELKDVCDFVTKNIDEDGIEYACKYLGLIY